MSEHHFRLRRGEFELELAGDRDFIEAQIARWLPALLPGAPEAPLTAEGPEEGPPADEIRRVPADFTPKVTITLGDLVRMKGASCPIDLVTVAGYYMEKYRRQERYTPQELQGALSGLAEWAGQGIQEPFEVAIESGYFEKLRDGSYTLTYKGQSYVQNGLAG